MQNQKIINHKPNIVSQILHPSEYILGMKLQDNRKGLLNISAPMGASYEDILICERILNESSLNMSHVIKELPDCLRLPVALFYLYYKILQVIYDIPLQSLENFNDFITTDISNDIIPSPNKIKMGILKNFYECLTNNDLDLKSIDAGTESSNELLYNIQTINNVFKTLPEYHQEIIEETIRRIGKGMGEYSLRDLSSGTEDKMDFEKYNLKLAGEFGVGLTKQFIGTNLESTTLNETDFPFAAKLGTFIKKTNIIRDYYKDLLNNKSFWPKEVWSLYRKTLPELRFGESSDVACLNHMITDTLDEIPVCIEYLSKIQNPKVFRFCAIPQIKSLAILAEAYGNRNVFTGIIQIRKGLYASILNNCNNIKQVKEWYQKFASQILDKVNSNDPNATRIIETLNILKAKKNLIPYQFQEIITILLIVSTLLLIAMCMLYIRPNFTMENGGLIFRLTKPPDCSIQT
jgi:farnesyl-diphosphate farnesyltransferase|tara:strand:+ start:616 stop:2001 length:1386 start_codon:yes stop_codon:yes gene_type:complete